MPATRLIPAIVFLLRLSFRCTDPGIVVCCGFDDCAVVDCTFQPMMGIARTSEDDSSVVTVSKIATLCSGARLLIREVGDMSSDSIAGVSKPMPALEIDTCT